MRLLKVLTIALSVFFTTADLYSQAPPPAEELKPQKAANDGPGGDPPTPGGTAVPLDGAMLLVLLAGGGILAGLVRKSKPKGNKD